MVLLLLLEEVVMEVRMLVIMVDTVVQDLEVMVLVQALVLEVVRIECHKVRWVVVVVILRAGTMGIHQLQRILDSISLLVPPQLREFLLEECTPTVHHITEW